MAMTGGMALAGDPFRENKESSAYWSREDEGPSDFFDEYVMLDDDDPLGPAAHTSGTYYDDLGFAPGGEVLSPPTSIDTSQLVSIEGSIDGARDHIQPHASLSFHHTRRYGSRTPGPQQLTQQTLEEQSGLSGSAQRRLDSVVSDSELQRLEELSVQSPRRGTAPPPSHSIPTSPRTQPTGAAQSPKKLGRMEMIYASIRKAATMRVRKMSSAPIGSDRDEEAQRGRSTKPASQTPMTPPPTGRMLPATPSQHDPLGISFVSGQYDDPFEGPFAGQHGQIMGYPPQHGYPAANMMMATNGQAAPNWPLTDGYASSGGNSAADDMVWVGNAHQPQAHLPQTPAGQDWYPATPGNPMKTVSRQSSSEFGTANAMNATLNLALHLQQGGHVYPNYGTVAGGHHHHRHHHHTHSESGLPIHMPQPRHAAGPILTQPPQHQPQHHPNGHSHSLSLDAQTHAYLAAPTPHSRPPRAGHQVHDPSTPRRPKPRAPSSGARHTSLSLSSPRKPPPLPHHQPRGRSSSSSPDKSLGAPARSARRVTSASDLHTHPSSSATRSDTVPVVVAAAGGVLNSSVRKRRSRSKSMSRASRTDLRTPSHGSLSSTSGGGDSPSKGGQGQGQGQGQQQIGFVNYTPDDSRVLMTGVAPSGSSKTKARREREAAERQRRLSEAVMKAVAAAGGDVARLKEEGIVLDGVEDELGGMPMVY